MWFLLFFIAQQVPSENCSVLKGKSLLPSVDLFRSEAETIDRFFPETASIPL